MANYTKQSLVIKEIREFEEMSQIEFARKFLKLNGNSGAQFVSNIERGLCGIPIMKLKRLKSHLLVPKLLEAMIDDYVDQLNEAFD